MEVFTQWTVLAALAVLVVQQILKLNVIPLYFANKYPVATNVILSVIASFVVNTRTEIHLDTVLEWVAYIGTVSVVAAIAYNMTIKNSEAVQRVSNKVEG